MLPKFFTGYLNEKDRLGVIIAIKDSVVYDNTLGEFDEMLKAAEAEIPDLYDEHNGDAFDEIYTEDVLVEQLAMFMMNFSKERVEYVRKICKALYGTKAEDNVVKLPTVTSVPKQTVTVVENEVFPRLETNERGNEKKNTKKFNSKAIAIGVTVAIVAVAVCVALIIKRFV